MPASLVTSPDLSPAERVSAVDQSCAILIEHLQSAEGNEVPILQCTLEERIRVSEAAEGAPSLRSRRVRVHLAIGSPARHSSSWPVSSCCQDSMKAGLKAQSLNFPSDFSRRQGDLSHQVPSRAVRCRRRPSLLRGAHMARTGKLQKT